MRPEWSLIPGIRIDLLLGLAELDGFNLSLTSAAPFKTTTFFAD